MSHTLYATFANPDEAEKAAGALLDRGVRAEDLSVVRQGPDTTDPQTTASNVVSSPGSVYGVDTPVADDRAVRERPDFVEGAENGITTTTGGDAAAGAVKGSLIGVGIGTVAAVAGMIVPGVGIVMGAGAIAAGIGGIIATAGAGAAAGAIVGYLKDMGVDDEVASDYNEAVQSGGAILALTVPSGEVTEEEAAAVLKKYAATNVNSYAARGYVA